MIQRAPVWPVAPMKAVSGTLPTGTGWRFEPKWDGHRTLVRRRSGAVAAVSSSGADRTRTWPWLVEAVSEQVSGDAIVDGEVIAIDEDGRHRFGLVGDPQVPHAFVAFDVLACDGRSLLDQPWERRRAELERLVRSGPALMITPTTDDGAALWDVTAAQSFEGVVAKRTDSAYTPGRRSRSWVKTKHRFDQEFLVLGWLPRTGSRDALGSLLLGAYDGGVIRFVGAAGSGLGRRLVDLLEPTLRATAASGPAAEGIPTGVATRARWVHPELVVQVRHGGWTSGGRLRHAVVLGTRDDVDPSTVTARDG